ncbi:MAG: GGDEF domain-containing protein [Gammaproteobacteria bacterium]|nr:GGDEF domain-containing protein [Gammaproteobacteria bacterium]
MEINKPIKLIRPLKPANHELTTSVTSSNSTGSVLNYALKFQSQICDKSLIQSYEECINSILNVSGVRYRYPLLGINHSLGITDNAQSNFHLKTDNEFWGDITLYRENEFSDNEMKNIELISSLLVHPLRSVINQKSNSLLSIHDQTTGIANSTLVEQLVTREAKLSHRERVPMSLVLIDIDRFNKISESANLIIRDEILYNVMQVMRARIRDTDLLFRYNNDTYCLILKGVTSNNAFEISERIRKEIDNNRLITINKKSTHITVSAGVAELLATDSIESIFERANNAVLHAKKMGRNQSIIADGKFIS